MYFFVLKYTYIFNLFGANFVIAFIKVHCKNEDIEMNHWPFSVFSHYAKFCVPLFENRRLFNF